MRDAQDPGVYTLMCVRTHTHTHTHTHRQEREKEREDREQKRKGAISEEKVSF